MKIFLTRSGSVPAPRANGSRNRAFTLVELIVSLAIGMLIGGAVLTAVIMSLRTIKKINMIDAAATNTRVVQEHLNKELSASISQKSPTRIVPTYEDPSSTTPTRYASITYRTTIGSFSTTSSASNGSSTITLDCPVDVTVKKGDFLMIDSPKLGTTQGETTIAGARIAQVVDSRAPNTSGTVVVTLEQSIAANTLSATKTDVKNGTLATIQRERRYVTVPRADEPTLAELRWFENQEGDDPIVLSRNIDANSRFLFTQITAPSDTKEDEPAISWQISYLTADTSTYLPGAKKTYYQTNYSEGLIMAKSGNPLNTSSYAGITTSTSISTSTTTSSTTSSTTTSRSTTTSTTSRSTTSTTSRSTTSTTSRSTTSKSTTSTTSRSTTSKSTTSTTRKTTSRTTSRSTTSVKTTTTRSTSTTSKSTTSKSTTTRTTTSIPLDG